MLICVIFTYWKNPCIYNNKICFVNQKYWVYVIPSSIHMLYHLWHDCYFHIFWIVGAIIMANILRFLWVFMKSLTTGQYKNPKFLLKKICFGVHILSMSSPFINNLKGTWSQMFLFLQQGKVHRFVIVLICDSFFYSYIY